MEAIQLSTADIRPIVPEETRRRIVEAIAKSVKLSSFGWKIETTTWRTWLNDELDAIFDGVALNLQFMRAYASMNPDVTEEDLYLIAERLTDEMGRLGIRVDFESTLSGGERDELKEHVAAGNTVEVVEFGNQKAPAGRTRIRLGALLVRYGLLSESQVNRALKRQHDFGGKFGTNLVHLGLIPQETLAHFLGIQLGMEAVAESALDEIDAEILRTMSVELVRKYHAVPVSIRGRVLVVALVDPTDLSAIDAISFASGMRVTAVIAPEAAIERAMAQHYGVFDHLRGYGSMELKELEPTNSGDLVIGDDRARLMDPHENFGATFNYQD